MTSSPWPRVVGAFHDAGKRARVVLEDPRVDRCWHEPSILPKLSVAGLAGHLLGVLRAFERRCDLPCTAEATVVDPAENYAIVRLARIDDLDQPQFALVRDNAERVGNRGHAAVTESYRTALSRLVVRLADESHERPIILPDTATATTLTDYTITRIVELVVHADDLAESVGVSVDPPSAASADLAIDFLVRAARFRMGEPELLRALAGRRPADLLRSL